MGFIALMIARTTMDPNTEPIRVAVDITVDKSNIEVDFSRSSDQVPAGLNSYINYTRAYTVFAVKVFCDALLPQNEGGIRPITTTAREGSFFNPTFFPPPAVALPPFKFGYLM
ncbi:MAG: hypothetical protein CM1200mP41_12350 [Gammaproteobacteria bacterium]|nr:MAG: hypothetical protein CM1200mP41_12350 [Gammaproteobacteria bacterium]